MKTNIIKQNNTISEIFKFEPDNGPSEYHIMIHATCTGDSYENQLNAILDTYSILRKTELKGSVAVFKRYFLSDAANQSDLLITLTTEYSDCAISVVQQPPLDGTKVALWAYMQKNVITRSLSNGLYEVKHNGYRHLWGGGAYNRASNSEYQTRLLLNDYVMQLMENGCTLERNCIRTWFFVQNVDVNYAGVVKARNEVFVTQNLTNKTHFIASTGIGGRQADPCVSVQMDTYAIDGIKQEQVHYLYAPTHLNPTYEYGVSFERGTYIEFGDRRHVYISGTASIDNKGEILYPGDIKMQTQRMWENVEVLLKEAEMDFNDVGQMIVYLRDTADYSVVKDMFDKRFTDMPKQILLAPVCRPGWLIEMECMGVRSSVNDEYVPY